MGLELLTALSAGRTPQETALVQLVQQKVTALHGEIDRYMAATAAVAAEREALSADRKALAASVKELATERAEFRNWRDAETAKLAAWKDEQVAKMERECRVAVRQARAAAATTAAPSDRHERAELEVLRAAAAKLKADVAAGEVRYKAAIDRHRVVLDKRDARIAELEAQVAAYEQLRQDKAFAAAAAGGGGGSAAAGRSTAGTKTPSSARPGVGVVAHAPPPPAAVAAVAAAADDAAPPSSGRASPSLLVAASVSVHESAPASPLAAAAPAAAGAPAAPAPPAAAAAPPTVEAGYNPIKYVGSGAAVASQPSVELARHVAYAPDRALLANSKANAVMGAVVAERALDGGKVERRYVDGTRIVTFRNGTEKETAPNGVVTVRFNNGDVKQTWVLPLGGAAAATDGASGGSDGIAVESYLYADSHVVHSTYANGLQAFEFPSGQLELHRPDGMVEVIFPDGTRALREAPRP